MEAEEMVEGLVGRALGALAEFEALDQEQVDHIVKKASLAALAAHGELARLAVEETGRGLFEDKAVKNLFACEHVTHSMAGLKTAGVIRRDELNGITEIAEPVGVVCAMTPVTNPTSTTVFKALIALKTRNPIVFAFHPSAQKCSAEAARTVRDAAVAAGAPADCVQWIEEPSMEATGLLMRHDGVSTILATGGNAMVKAAYSCGKPALGVGAGNVPAYVAKDARLARAVHDIVLSKTFDNGMICASEQAVVLDAEVYEAGIAEFERLGAHVVTAAEKAKLEEYLFGATARSGDCGGARLNADAVGKSAEWIAGQAGFEVPEGTSILLAECAEVGENEPLTREKLSPVLAALKAGSTEQGLELAAAMVEFHGLGHSAAVHTEDEALAEEFGRRVKAIRVIVNAPSTFGGIGDVYNAFLPSLTLGCGSYGHNSVSDNVTAVNLVNVKRIGRRNTNMQWYKIPPKIYFERNAIRYLGEMEDVHRVTIVTDRTMGEIGFVAKVTDILDGRADPVAIQVIDDVEPNPELATVRAGAAAMRDFRPDTVVALGGGSPMDAAKIMWLMYERPEVEFADAKEKFFDIRKRAYTFPKPGEKAKLVAIPTTSGTGSEVTPFAVISDPEAAQKYPLADYALTPDVAIVDPVLPLHLPPTVTADSGFDALTHATEAYVSAYANDFTDGQCLQAIRLIFENLETCVKEGAQAPEARERMHNASTIAGMAFANAFLGLVHAMAHTLGHTFHVAHGRANALLLPHVIRHNGTVTHKAVPWPKAEVYRAPERYQEIARMLGLPAATPEEGVESYARAVEELRERCGIPAGFRAEGVDEAAFMAALPQQAMNAYADQCAPANPRMPMIDEMKELMVRAYHGE
ncbi:bifunctional acetaldehyde-CoA/alcohol dehydrogenase [Streptomyces sp. R302]|uniref:bifunctional acetaldehyde-CoA/alcohol dehydrogenase n=1 Tax=unclassified Streptomyces TaxID=2593676 RepID=UPI00145EC625|nr:MULTISPECIES: bifunctional acetaldehyde-CoA/alcohol dehydrogenase [unclassified Streptomyces]NML54461.1 bifunctional acetaldehyde-CoA/alcohol dehydrogenase [Streptomyces sp. R301]NML81723.1 bifunctional acetaldehyde-CoA/alcohol dehydrogenase [Streptomyces sp. R302]